MRKLIQNFGIRLPDTKGKGKTRYFCILTLTSKESYSEHASYTNICKNISQGK